jgi:biopolymer transport protein ExbB
LNTLIKFFQDGGPFMFAILAVLAVGLAVTIERYIYLTAAKAKNRCMINKLMPPMAKGEMNVAIKLTKESNATVSKILLQGMEHFKSARRRDDFEAAME